MAPFGNNIFSNLKQNYEENQYRNAIIKLLMKYRQLIISELLFWLGFLCFVFKTGFLCVALAILELTL